MRANVESEMAAVNKILHFKWGGCEIMHGMGSGSRKFMDRWEGVPTKNKAWKTCIWRQIATRVDAERID
jgi:hypothetical protein